MSDLHPEALTWTALLGRWVEFAQASLALPEDAEGRRWRESVPAIIALQAVTFALGDLERLPPEDRPHGRAKAEVVINRSVDDLEAIWEGEEIPAMLHELAQDADRALHAALYAGLTELIWDGPGTMVMPEIELDHSGGGGGGGGTLGVMHPGTIVMPGEPVAWWCDRSGEELRKALPGCREHRPEGGPRQIYRLGIEDGRIDRDVIARINDDEPPGGFPLIVPLRLTGEPIGAFTMEPDEWEEIQRRAMGDAEVPVETRGA